MSTTELLSALLAIALLGAGWCGWEWRNTARRLRRSERQRRALRDAAAPKRSRG